MANRVYMSAARITCIDLTSASESLLNFVRSLSELECSSRLHIAMLTFRSMHHEIDITSLLMPKFENIPVQAS